jgi:hypothetical protein
MSDNSGKRGDRWMEDVMEQGRERVDTDARGYQITERAFS